jgi:predicted phage terminase large subunit-like protein
VHSTAHLLGRTATEGSRTHELELAGGLIERSKLMLANTRAHWSGDTRIWTFPGPGRTGAGGATLTFAYLGDSGDLGRYHGTSYQFVGFDELTQFEENDYLSIHRVVRTPSGPLASAPDGTRLQDVPERIRATSNPGGRGHEWVKRRFVDPASRVDGVVYLHSVPGDNPHIPAAYSVRLANLPTTLRARLLDGNWDMPDEGELFRSAWFTLVEPHEIPSEDIVVVRCWDLAATEPSGANPDPDWTVGLKLVWHRPSGTFYIADIIRERKGPGAVEELVAATAERDGKSVTIVLEQEPGAAGKAVAEHYVHDVLAGFRVKPVLPSGDKLTRAIPVAAEADKGLVRLIRARHTDAFLDELTAFPHGKHDDCVDALSGAHAAIDTRASEGGIYIAEGTIDDSPIDFYLSRIYGNRFG